MINIEDSDIGAAIIVPDISEGFFIIHLSLRNSDIKWMKELSLFLSTGIMISRFPGGNK